jgi:hypothetical protein
VLFMGKVPRAGFVRQQDRDVVVGKIRRLELLHNRGRLGFGTGDTKH